MGAHLGDSVSVACMTKYNMRIYADQIIEDVSFVSAYITMCRCNLVRETVLKYV